MKVFLPARHRLHHPSEDFSDGLPPFKHLETPERIDRILEGLKTAGVTDILAVNDLASAAVRRLHDRDYVDFLTAISCEISEGREYIPPLFHSGLVGSPLWFQGGLYCREIGTPVGPHSIEAALNSAATAIAAAEFTVETTKDSLALCRPPGHHAGLRRYGGYCFFNNAYLAALTVRQSGMRTAVLDIDYHVGDGSIEFASADAPYYSLHADVARNYPYMAPLAELENEHVVLRSLRPGIMAAEYLSELKTLIADMNRLAPEIVTVSLGFDILSFDYMQDEQTAITVDDFAAIGELLAAVLPPAVLILEGGYDLQHLPACVSRFFGVFLSGRPEASGQ